jgi:uncharacterized RDD family membrane protein YckC
VAAAGDGGRPVRVGPTGYAGIVTRAVALVIDSIVLDVIAIAVAAAVQLLISLFTGHSNLGAVAAVVTGILWFVWAGVYFATFWNLTGETPGNRVLGIRVTSVDGGDIGVWQAILRYFGLVLAALPLGLGFVPVLFNERRRGLQDWIGGTVVRWVEQDGGTPDAPSPAAQLTPGPVLTARAATLPAAPPRADS